MIVRGAILLDRVANFHLHRLAALPVEQLFSAVVDEVCRFPRDRISTVFPRGHQHAADLVGRKKIRVFSADLDSEASSRQRASAFTTRDSTPNSTISVTEYGRFRIRDPYSA
jgi:hypothetical protein